MRPIIEQYPEGSFVTLARARLDEFTDDQGHPKEPAELGIEQSFWESVRESDNPDSLQAYLEKYPDGEFRALAEIRLKELGEAPAAAVTRRRPHPTH